MRWVRALAAFLGIGRVAGAVLDTDIEADLFDRTPQVALDISRQRFQRRDVGIFLNMES